MELPKTEEMCVKNNENYINVEDLKRRGRNINNRCPKCDKLCESNIYLLEHLTSHQGSPLSCKKCQNTFGNRKAYDYHTKLNLCQDVKTADKRRKICQLLSKTSPYCGDFTNHLVDVHRCIDCKTCTGCVIDRKHLQSHSLEVQNKSLEDYNFR